MPKCKTFKLVGRRRKSLLRPTVVLVQLLTWLSSVDRVYLSQLRHKAQLTRVQQVLRHRQLLPQRAVAVCCHQLSFSRGPSTARTRTVAWHAAQLISLLPDSPAQRVVYLTQSLRSFFGQLHQSLVGTGGSAKRVLLLPELQVLKLELRILSSNNDERPTRCLKTLV